MKKIALLVSLCLLVAGSSFAATLGPANLDATALSNGVSGVYFTDTARQAYVLETGHSSGNRAFASGSFATTVSYRETTTPTSFVLTDVSSGTFDSTLFDSSDTWTAVGD